MIRDPFLAWEDLVDAFAASLPDQTVEPWKYLDSVLLLAQRMRLPRVHTDGELVELIADGLHWRTLPEVSAEAVLPDIEGDPAPTLIENLLADSPSDIHQAVRDHFRRCRVPIPDDATVNKMLERHHGRQRNAPASADRRGNWSTPSISEVQLPRVTADDQQMLLFELPARIAARGAP
jgi:hypothetical protein